MLKHSFSSFLLGGALLLSSLSARAQTTGPIGQIISYQGKLSDANGVAVANGTQSLAFSIQEAGSATPLFSTTQSVATIGGVFNTFLGVGALSFDPAKSYTLSVTFNNQTTTHPIAAVPFAQSATTAGNVSGVVPVANGGTGSSTQNFVDLTTAQTVAGAKTFSGVVTVPQVNIGPNRILGASSNGRSVFLGPSAGAANGNANFNVLLGGFAGEKTTGDSNIFVGDEAGRNTTSGSNNTALGESAGTNWTTGSGNIAINNFGVPGESNTTRIGEVQTRTFVAGIRGATGLTGTLPVVVDGDGQLGTGTASSLGFVDLTSAQTVGGAKSFSSAVNSPQYNIGGARVLAVPGSLNTFVGQSTGASNTGSNNTFLGGQAGASNSSAISNTFVGAQAGLSNTSAINNTFVGAAAGARNTGTGNTFIGVSAGAFNTSGNSNIALGLNAGSNLTTGSDNIAIGNGGVAGESNTTRIGASQTRAFIAGIRGVVVPGGSAVFIDANGQLGTATSSSARFKQDVAPIGAGSDWLLKLRPVSYRYTPQFLKGAAPSDVQYGLIAEEVAKVAPQMVHLDEKGRPDGVDYGSLPVMLLSQIQQQQKTIEALQARLKKIEAGR